ncbi:serine/threonine protein kinase [Oligoflexaceae bacterium]|nr:serine/threonine protein kinase [Oligoflexaceae bacterium]
MTKSTKMWGENSVQFFYELTPEKIFDCVETFGLRCTGRCSALNSMENRVYDIEVIDETNENNETSQVIAKFYRPGRWSMDQIKEEHLFLANLDAAEIPAIAPILNPSDGHSLILPKTPPIAFAVFPKVGGRSPDELSNEQYEIVGRLLARMHNVGASLKAEHRIELSHETYGLGYIDYFNNSDFVPSDQKAILTACIERICEISGPWLESADKQLIHGDAHLGNLLHGRDGFFWVDFDDSVIGPAVQDLWLILPGRDLYAKEKLGHLLKGYEMMRPFDRSQLRLIEPLRALRMIHFAAWIGIRYEDPAFKRAFPFYKDPSYWQNLNADLRDQLSFIAGGDGEFSW